MILVHFYTLSFSAAAKKFYMKKDFKSAVPSFDLSHGVPCAARTKWDDVEQSKIDL